MQHSQYREALRLIHQSNFSNNAIGKALGISPNTVKRCRAVSHEQTLDWETVQAMDDRELLDCFLRKRNRTSDKVMPDWSEIQKLMQVKHQTLIQLWEEYQEQYKCNAYSYSQFTYHYRLFLKKVDVCMRQVHYAGETVFVDYAGKTIPYWDNRTQEQKRAQVFVGVLGCSNYTFAWASASQKLPDWLEAHSKMFAFFGGVPATIVPDNLKSAVTVPGRNLMLNRSYQDLAEHYGCIVVPARVRKPQDKSKAEIGVKLITQWISIPLSRQQFFSLEEMNEAISELLVKFNQRPLKRLPGNRLSRFEELDKPVLKPLPREPYQFSEWTAEQKVGPDYHLLVRGHAYSVPFQLVGEKVSARISANMVELFCLNKRVATHVRNDLQGEATTDPNHRPASHQAYANLSFEHFLSWANRLGESVVSVVEAQFSGKPQHSLSARKACSQLQGLTKQYGETRLAKACQRALTIQSPTLKSIRSILQHNLDATVETLDSVKTQIPSHENVRGSDYYQGGSSHD